MLAALFFWRLSAGPVKVDFLTPLIEQTLNDAETGVRVEIGDTVLNWGGSAQELEPGSFNFRAFDIRARDVRVRGRSGALIAAVPALGISFDMRELLRGHIQPTVLTLVQPELRLQRTIGRHRRRCQDGRTGGRAGRYRPDEGGAEGASTAARQPARPAVAADRSAGRWRPADAGRSGDASGLAGPRADVTLRRDEGGLRGFARLDLAVGKRITRLNTDLTFRSGDGITRMQTRFDNIAPAELADRAPELDIGGAGHGAARAARGPA